MNVRLLNAPLFVAMILLAYSLSTATASAPQTSVRAALECHACYYLRSATAKDVILFQQVEGLLSENATQVEIEARLDALICSKLHSTSKSICETVISLLPFMIEKIEAGAPPAALCESVRLCTKRPYNGVDGQSIPAFTINLDLPPSQRWNAIAQVSQYSNLLKTLWSEIQSFLNTEVLDFLLVLGNDAWTRLDSVFQEEIRGASNTLGLPYEMITLLNLLYDITDGCTSIVAQTENGTILHARNLDFGTGMDDTELLRQLAGTFTYLKGGKPLFVSFGFPFYSGVISGFRPDAFAVTINTRFLPKGPLDQITTAIDFLLHHDAQPVTFLSRMVVENETNYYMALERLSERKLIDDVYYTLSGKSMRGCVGKELCGPNQGTVITRNRENATDTWHVSPPQPWFILQTNYDHWTQAPWYDDRADAGNNAMNAIGWANVSLDAIYDKVLSKQPVLNLQTIMSIIMSVDLNTYSARLRSCSDPCPF